MKLLRTLILRPLRRDLLRTALSVAAVALGVATIVAIDLAGDAATGSFRSSMESLAGKTDLEIAANGGVDEAWMGPLTALPVNARFSPVMESQAVVPGVGVVPLFGLDLPWAAGVSVSKALAARLPRGESLHFEVAGRAADFPVARVVDVGAEEFLALDVAEAQKVVGRYGKLDRIDVTVAPGEDVARVEQAVRATVPAPYLIQKPGARSEENQRMLRAFRWNLRVLSYISLVVGAFLIYNTISVSVVRRRAEIGVLRALGASRGAVLVLFLVEALLLGIAGGALGVALGRILAAGTVRLIADTVNALYTTSRPSPVELSWGEAWTGLLAGAVVALVSAIAPAREATGVTPTEAMSRGAHEHHARLRWRRGLVWAALAATLAVAFSQAPPLGGVPSGGYAAAFSQAPPVAGAPAGAMAVAFSQPHPVAGVPAGGYAAALLAIAAAALATPAVVILIHRMTRLVAKRRVESMLAGRSLTASLSRTSVVVAALATAVAMMASVGIMVGSFRETVSVWLDTQLRADISVGARIRAGAGEHPPLSAEVPALVKSVAGVAAVDVYHSLEFHYRGERSTLGAGDMDVVRRYGRLRFLRGEDRDAILRSLPHQDRAIVSEPFAQLHGVRAGDRLTLPIGDRSVTLTVSAIYYDYSSPQGYVIVDRSTLLRYLPGQPVTNLAVYFAPGADRNGVLRDIQLRTAGYGVTIRSNGEVRRTAMAVFDRTFAITWALEAVAIVVAMLGAANSLLALVLDRRRELGLLRYLGASAGQIRGMILTEAAFLGLLAGILGLALGFALSLLLIFVVNKQSFGWTIQFHPPGELLSGALLLVWCVTVLAGLYPARVAARLNPIDVIHEE